MKKLLDLDGTVLYQENYLKESMEDILMGIVWRNDPITMFGKTYPQPRLTAWHGDPGLSYTYSKITMRSPGWSPILLKIRDQLEKDLKTPFNSVLLNYYRDGNDHMSYHSDDELELGVNPTIASLSLGATRKFSLKHRLNKIMKPVDLFLESQNLLVMKDELQHFWQHKIGKSTKIKAPRLNLTYRNIIR
ncbi:MAG: alpha-ketoglutarate-dependent dioxygenase AlkB [Bacteriovorax sp.]|nr:alpha-ketoglutarate-dependent dioxygenase AlkB [Bacteriovorax sp.]